MKRPVFRLISLLLALALCLPLASCGKSGDVVRYKDYAVSRAIFSYQCAMDKTSYLYEAYHTTSDKTPASQLQDNPAIWSMEDKDGVSVAATLKQGVVDSLKWMLYLEQAAKDRGKTLNEEQRASVKNSLNEMVKNFETKSGFNEAMKPYGINYDQMYEYYLHQGLASIGEHLLFGEGGEMEITDAAAKTYFEKNYITVGCIFINDQNKTYPNGKTVYLPESEKAEKRALAEELYQRLLAGEDFAALYRQYSDRQWDNGDTYTFTKGGFGNDKAEEAAFALSTGSVTKVDTDAGIFLLIRRGLNNSHFDTIKDTITTTLKNQKKDALMKDLVFTVDQAFVDSLDIAEMAFVR